MTFGFWNINGNKLDNLILRFTEIYNLDVLMLGESPYDPLELLLILNSKSPSYYYSPGNICEKIQFFSKLKPEQIEPLVENKRISARKLFSSKYGNVILIAAHYNSKVNWSNDDQSAHIPTFKSIIDRAETTLGHSRTIICGDLNMNPFDNGMIQSTGLHSVMEKSTARKANRIIDGDPYTFFYNPMWGFLGDLGRGKVSGTLYYSPAKPINYHWNLFDQVLIRPDLIDSFVDSDLDIITEIGDQSLLTLNELINDKISDHLPIKFKLNI